MPIRGSSHTELSGVQLQQFAERRYVMFSPTSHVGSGDADEVTFIGKFAGISNPSISPSLK